MAPRGRHESPHLGLNHEPVQLPERPADFEDRYVAYVNGQIEELLTWYGHDRLPLVRRQRRAEGVLPRADPQAPAGDHRERPPARPGRCRDGVTMSTNCPTRSRRAGGSTASAWPGRGAIPSRSIVPPTSLLLSKLARVRTWGGNVLANYGPRPDGEMPDCFYRNMAEMKDWMGRSGVSLVDVEPGPYPGQVQRPGHHSRQDVVRPSIAQDLRGPGLRRHDRAHGDAAAETSRDACHGESDCRECRWRQVHDRGPEGTAHGVGRCCCD